MEPTIVAGPGHIFVCLVVTVKAEVSNWEMYTEHLQKADEVKKQVFDCLSGFKEVHVQMKTWHTEPRR
jgi:hypothetical protein